MNTIHEQILTILSVFPIYWISFDSVFIETSDDIYGTALAMLDLLSARCVEWKKGKARITEKGIRRLNRYKYEASKDDLQSVWVHGL